MVNVRFHDWLLNAEVQLQSGQWVFTPNIKRVYSFVDPDDDELLIFVIILKDDAQIKVYREDIQKLEYSLENDNYYARW